MSDFFGLQVGLSALYASRKAMEVSASNIANANVDGYSRQRVTVSSAGAPLTAAVHARSESSLSGVKVDKVIRTRDEFLQTRANSEYANQSFLERQQSLLSRIELTFSEPSDTGIQSQLADFWASFEDLSNNPGSQATRSQLIERGRTVVTSINQASGELGELWRTSVQQLETIVKGVNATAERVAELNGSIKRATASGLSPNELLDQRDNLALELARMVGGEVRGDELGTIGVYVGGTAIVRGEEFSALEVFVPTGTNIITANDSTATNVQLRWVKDNFRATVGGGEAGALLDAVNNLLPGYREALIGSNPPNGVSSPSIAGDGVGALASFDVDFSVPANTQTFDLTIDGVTRTVTLNKDLRTTATNPHTAGDVAAALTDAIATAFSGADVSKVYVVADGGSFSIESLGYGAPPAASLTIAAGAGTTAIFGATTATAGTGRPGEPPGLAMQLARVVNLQHRQGVDSAGGDAADFFSWTQEDGLAMAITDSTKIGAASHTEGTLGGSNSSALADMSLLKKGPDDIYRNVIIRLGVEAQTANRRLEIQENITNQVDAARDAESGVNIDEEMAFMVAFQHSYGAASRLITAIDEMLTRLINGTGLAGRG